VNLFLANSVPVDRSVQHSAGQHQVRSRSRRQVSARWPNRLRRECMTIAATHLEETSDAL
jgi:hypothetical protein